MTPIPPLLTLICCHLMQLAHKGMIELFKPTQDGVAYLESLRYTESITENT